MSSRDHYTADQSYVWLSGQGPVVPELSLRTRLYTRSVCDTTAPLQLQLPLVTLYKCYAITFFPYYCLLLLRSQSTK